MPLSVQPTRAARERESRRFVRDMAGVRAIPLPVEKASRTTRYLFVVPCATASARSSQANATRDKVHGRKVIVKLSGREVRQVLLDLLELEIVPVEHTVDLA